MFGSITFEAFSRPESDRRRALEATCSVRSARSRRGPFRETCSMMCFFDQRIGTRRRRVRSPADPTKTFADAGLLQSD